MGGFIGVFFCFVVVVVVVLWGVFGCYCLFYFLLSCFNLIGDKLN